MSQEILISLLGSPAHVNMEHHLANLLKSIADCLPQHVSPQLQPFVDFVRTPTVLSPKTCVRASCISCSPIPFEFPLSMKAVLKQEPCSCFSVSGDIAHLVPNAQSSMHLSAVQCTLEQ